MDVFLLTEQCDANPATFGNINIFSVELYYKKVTVFLKHVFSDMAV